MSFIKSFCSIIAILFMSLALRVHAASNSVIIVKDSVTYDRGSNTLTVTFGYINGTANTVIINYGGNNSFDPLPNFRGQPTQFAPGYHSNAFQTTFPADSYCQWYLSGNLMGASMADIAQIQYQGRLCSDGLPTTGLMDFQFRLFDAATDGNQLLNTLDFSGDAAVPVTNGLFNVILPWGQGAFTDSSRWLDIQVRPANGSNYVTLSPRQPLTSAPYAANAKFFDGLPSNLFARLVATNFFLGPINAPSFVGDGSSLVNLNLNVANFTGNLPDNRLSTNVALLNSVNTFSAAMKLGPVISRGSFPGRLEIEQGNVNEPALRLSSTSSGHGSGLWLENRSGSTNTWSIYCASNGTFEIGKQELTQGALTINPTTLNVSVVSLSQTSDRNAKENFGDINPLDVLEKVASLDIKRWNFKGITNSVHIGPMAQDFYAAFGTGEDERHIATVDADGVALASIQGLNKKLSVEVEALRRENKELSERLHHIEEVLKTR